MATTDTVLIKREPHWLEPFRIEYDSKYITLFGRNTNYPGMWGLLSGDDSDEPFYEETVLPYNYQNNGCIEIRNASPFIKSVTDSEIEIQLFGAW